MYNYEGDPVVSNCKFSGNSAEIGGATCNWLSSSTFTNCTFSRNAAQLVGGGIFVDGDNFHPTAPIIINCTFFGNDALYGGAVYCGELSSPTIVNSILWGDSAANGPEIAMTTVDWGSSLSVSFSDVQGGETGVYDSCFLDWGPGNIDVDPCFADPDVNNFHLKSQAGRWNPNSESWVIDVVTSPCIDAGDMASP